MAIPGILSVGIPVFFVAQVVVHLTFQNSLYSTLLELAKKRVKFFSVLELLEEFLAECIFFFHNNKCEVTPAKVISVIFLWPEDGPKNSRITFTTTYTLIGMLPRFL
jgi:hypothetical protein